MKFGGVLLAIAGVMWAAALISVGVGPGSGKTELVVFHKAVVLVLAAIAVAIVAGASHLAETIRDKK